MSGYAAVAIRCMLFTVFLVAVWGKVSRRSSLRDFVHSVRELGLFPPRSVPVIVLGVLVAEAAILLSLPLHATATMGMVAATVLTMTFIATIHAATQRGHAVPCRCFGPGSSAMLGKPHVYRNAVLATIALFGAINNHAASWEIDPVGAVIAGLAGAWGALLIVMMDDLARLVNPGRPMAAHRRQSTHRSGMQKPG